MQRSASELMLEAAGFPSDDGGEEWSPSLSPLSLEESFLPPVLSDRELDDLDEISRFFADYETWLLNNPTPNQSNISAIEVSSIYAGTPTSSHKPGVKVNQALGGTSGSDQSDEESVETDATDIKRMRRMASNRESAMRSRKRKQAQLEGLELQVDRLRGDKSSLFKELTNANQEFTEAVTNNYILKSNVEALRIKVKMAEDLVLVSRGTLACSSFDHLLPSNIGSPQFLNHQQPYQSSPDFLPAIDFQEDDSYFIGVPSAGQFRSIGVDNNDAKNADVGSEHCKHNEPAQ